MAGSIHRVAVLVLAVIVALGVAVVALESLAHH